MTRHDRDSSLGGDRRGVAAAKESNRRARTEPPQGSPEISPTLAEASGGLISWDQDGYNSASRLLAENPSCLALLRPFLNRSATSDGEEKLVLSVDTVTDGLGGPQLEIGIGDRLTNLFHCCCCRRWTFGNPKDTGARTGHLSGKDTGTVPEDGS